MLAGGRSVRFGDVDKLTAEIGGVPILALAVEAVASVADDVVVVLAPGRDPQDVPPPGRPTFDAAEGDGPLAGLDAGLRACDAEVALVVGGDMPELQPAVLRAMVAELEDPAIDLVVLDDGERPRPLPLAVRTRAAAAAAEALLGAERRRLRDLFGELPTAVLDQARWRPLDPSRRTLRDVDEPADLNG